MTSSEERAWEKVSDLEDQIADIKAKMLTDEKPCKDCDNGCNWEK